MSGRLPPLRFNLDFLPSTDPERPGLFIRDPYHYSDATLLVPPPLVRVLECFDGDQSPLDLRSQLVRITGEIEVSELEKHLYDSLDQAGFLENDRYREMKARRELEFVSEPVREAVFAGPAYPSDPIALQNLLDRQIGREAERSSAIAIAAPHASPEAAWRTYRAAYRELPTPQAAADLTFVILGTSHYGAPERFGLTRKAFASPFGETRTANGLVDELLQAAPDAVCIEDYCHAVEHSIEFQVVFLQYLYGANVRILPVLCGPFVKSLYEGGMPENTPAVARFFDALSNIGAREGKRLFYVLGVDMSHIGRRYGDPIRAKARVAEMLAVEQRDRARIDQITFGNTRDFWSLVQQGNDDLKWCGSAPFYTFLRTQPALSGKLLDYHQWQIDADSVVSFSALRFSPET